MNRVKTAQVPTAWGLSYDYDRYGNLLDKTVTQGGGPTELHVTVNNKNQINSGGFGYDAAGNLTSYDTQSYAYDGESRMTSTAGVSYSYDGGSLRVKKDQTSGSTYDTLYWRGIGLGLLFETDLTGTTEQGKSVLFNGQRLVRRADEKPYYYIDDHLGSRRLLLGPTGGNYHESDYYPFGGERVIVDTADAPYKFTGYERDAESGHDYAVFRYYASTLGRFCSADPVGGDIANPQSLNRYTYVVNNPTNLIDPLGLTHEREWVCEWDPDKEVFVCGWKVNPHSDPDNPAGFHGGCVIPGTSISVPCTVGIGTAGVWGDEVDPAKLERLKERLEWWKEFGRAFVRNVQKSCFAFFVKETGRNFVDPLLSGGVDAASASYAATQYNAALRYAATTSSRTFGTSFLLYPMRSGVFRGFLSRAAAAPVAGQLINLNLSMTQALIAEYKAAASGKCH